jgi:hypothetical protein
LIDAKLKKIVFGRVRKFYLLHYLLSCRFFPFAADESAMFQKIRNEIWSTITAQIEPQKKAFAFDAIACS